MLLPNEDMEQTTELQRIINGCIAMEYSVAAMYSTFVNLFPKDRLFWTKLFDDQMEHTLRVENVVYVKSIDLLPTMDPLQSIELIENTIEYAENQRRQIRTVSLKGALEIAFRLEESLLEIYSNEVIENVLSTEHELLSKKFISFKMLHINKIVDMLIKIIR